VDSFLRKKQREVIAGGSAPHDVEAFIHAVMRSQDESFILGCIQKWLKIYNEKAKVPYFLKPQQSSTSSLYFTLADGYGFCDFKQIFCVLLNEQEQPITDTLEVYTIDEDRILVGTYDLYLQLGEMLSIPLNMEVGGSAIFQFALTNGGPLRVNIVGETK
tara:strand:- start:750 stop:1229 length:480 start_codon:yes stop_codon:yes gene_type:complete